MYGWTEISVAAGENPIDKIEPGDIFVRRDETGGHVQIIAEVNNGDVTAYDCGNASNWLGHNGSPHTANWFLADSRPGKIIRVTEP
jgi:hypothetical protein